MRFARLSHELTTAHRATVILLGLLVLSLATSLALAVLAMQQWGRERVVLVPPTISRTFWVEPERVSAEYLEQMGYFLMQLVLNVTPQSAEHQSRVLLQYASPGAAGELRTQLAQHIERLRRDGAATVFSAQEVLVDERGLRVGIRGQLTTYVSERRVSETPRGYLIEFRTNSGRLTLAAFRETPAHDPLDTRRSARPDAGR